MPFYISYDDPEFLNGVCIQSFNRKLIGYVSLKVAECGRTPPPFLCAYDDPNCYSEINCVEVVNGQGVTYSGYGVMQSKFQKTNDISANGSGNIFIRFINLDY